MSTPNTTRWIGIGLLGLPLYGALTFWSSLEGQPDPDTQLEAWARFVTTNEYVIGHLFGSILGLIFLIFGVFALGVYLATSRAGRMGLWAMFLTVLGSALFLPLQGVSTFAVPEEGQAVLAGLEEFEALPDIFANTVAGLTGLVVILLGFVGHILVGVALRDAAEVGGSPLGWGQRVDVLESCVRSDDRPREHPVHGAIGGCGASDKWGVDGLERAAPILHCPRGRGSRGPTEGAIT